MSHWDRRQFLTAATAVSAASLFGGCGRGTESHPAFSGWNGPLHVSDIRMRLVGWASLAPSFYNLQPWRVALEGDDVLWLLADPKRARLHSDPLLRQTTLSQGTFLELLRLAALSEGWEAHINLFPEGPYNTVDDIYLKPVARVSLRRAFDMTPPSLFGSVRLRRTCTKPFQTRAILPKVRESLLKQVRSVPGVTVGWLDRGMNLERIKSLIIEGLRRTSFHATLIEEHTRYLRLTDAEIAQNRDGLMSPFPFPGEGIRLFYGDRAFSEPKSWLNRWTFNRSVAHIAEAAHFVWVGTDGRTRHDQVSAGRAYARLDLAAAANGLSLQPFAPPLTGHPIVVSLQDSLQNLLASGQTVHMIARIGYTGGMSPTPRRAADELVI